MAAQGKQFSFRLSEDEARKFVSQGFKKPQKMLADLDRAKKETTIKRTEFVKEVNSGSKLLEAFIKSPLPTLRKHKLLDAVRSVTLNFPPEVIAVDPRPRICLEQECVESHVEMVCLHSEEYMGLSVCREYLMVWICDEWRLRLVPCD